MIEVIGTKLWSPKVTYYIEGSWGVDDAGVLQINGEMDDRGRRHVIATHASGTWSSVRRVNRKIP